MTKTGSSPRMRGAQQAQGGLDPHSEDHPRGCGEHCGYKWIFCPKRGSSPRMRGARRLLRGHHAGPGIIPADAGSTMLRPLF